MRPVVVFDLDGTLVDSLEEILASFRFVLTGAGLPVPDDARLRSWIGLPLAETFARLAPPEAVAELTAAYRRHYLARLGHRTRPYPGVPERLAELRAAGFGLAVATTKRSGPAKTLLERVGLLGFFDHVQGTDEGMPAKPDPEVVRRAVAGAGGAGVAMVGDTVHDVAAARAAGLAAYAVTWGAGRAEALAAAGADRVAPDLEALPDWLAAVAVRFIV